MKRMIVANWKMNTTLSEALLLANGVKEGVADLSHIEVVLCPPFPWLVSVAEAVEAYHIPFLRLGAQNLFWKEEGAFTGEVSATMLRGLADYVILGHSERRRIFHESDTELAAKLALAVAAGLRPILCVGELKAPSSQLLADPGDLTERQIAPILHQLTAAIKDLPKTVVEKLIIAYEPVWAISTTKNPKVATGFYANQVARYLRKELAKKVGDAASDMLILYGGSVNPENAAEFIHQSELQGVLVGGASLKVKSFVSICQQAAGN